MRATIIVKDQAANRIVKLRDVNSIDEVTVSEVVSELERAYPAPAYRIDTSQIEMALESLRAA